MGRCVISFMIQADDWHVVIHFWWKTGVFSPEEGRPSTSPKALLPGVACVIIYFICTFLVWPPIIAPTFAYQKQQLMINRLWLFFSQSHLHLWWFATEISKKQPLLTWKSGFIQTGVPPPERKWVQGWGCHKLVLSVQEQDTNIT